MRLGIVVSMGIILSITTELSTAQQPKADTRSYWVYEGGWFAKDKDGRWYEMNESLYRNGGKPARYGEAKRTQNFVDIYDDSRRKYVRFYDKYAETLNKKGDWEKILDGHWAKAE